MRESEETGIVFTGGVNCLGRRAKAAAAHALYLSPRGDDRNSGASPATALRTFAHALCNLSPGQVLNVIPGVYRESETYSHVLPTLQETAAAKVAALVLGDSVSSSFASAALDGAGSGES